MKCLKCEGFMCLEEYGDYFLSFKAWRCVNCGAILDPTILSNKGILGEPGQAMAVELN